MATGACSKGESAPVRASNGEADSTARPVAPRDVIFPGIAAGGAPYVARAVPDGGTIAGTVTLDGAAPPDTTVRPDSAVARACGASFVDRTLARRGERLGGVVVWLEGVRGGKALPTLRRHQLSLRRCQFEPRALAAVAGGTLNVHSTDPIGTQLRVVRWPEGQIVAHARTTDAGQVVPDERALARAGALEVRGTQHPWLRAWLLVFDHPYFATSEGDGGFRLDSVPPGSYRLIAWHERLGRVEQPVTVGAGQASTVPIVMRARVPGAPAAAATATADSARADAAPTP